MLKNSDCSAELAGLGQRAFTKILDHLKYHF